MGKKTFLKAVALFACLSILMLSAPGAIASERTVKKSSHWFMKMRTMISSFLPFLNLNINNEKGGTSSYTTSNNDSNRKIMILGGKHKMMLGDED